MAVVVVAILAVALFAIRGQSGGGVDATIVAAGHAEVGHAAPDFTTPLLNGGTVRLSSLRGKVVRQRFLSQAGVKFTAALDPDGKIADAYGVTFGLPTSVFVDRDGTVRVIHLGQMAPDFIDQRALSLL